MEMMHSIKSDNAGETRDTLMLLGGVALLMLGAGMVLASPMIRRYLGAPNVAGLLQAAFPDIERYMKLKAM